MSVHTGGQAFASVNLCGHVFVGISARAEACLSFWVWVPAPAEICKCVCTFVCLDVCVIVCLCKCLCLQVSVCLCECVPVGMSIHEHAVGAQERRLWVPPPWPPILPLHGMTAPLLRWSLGVGRRLSEWPLLTGTLDHHQPWAYAALPQKPSSPFHSHVHVLTLLQVLGQFIWLGRWACAAMRYSWSCGCTGDSARAQEGPLGPRRCHFLTAHTYMSSDSDIPGHIPKHT